MPIKISPETKKRLQEKVSSGAYSSIDEVVEEGLRLLDARDRKLAALRAAEEPELYTDADLVERNEDFTR